VYILQQIHHASIISYVASETRKDGRGVLYLEYVSYPTLSHHLRYQSTLTESVSVKVLYQLVDAVHYLHSKGISHHDIKPENMIYNHGDHTIKLFDFGLAVTVKPDFPITNSDAGSPLYMAPEVLLEDTHNAFYSDVWSIGICLYEFLAGKTPFQNCEDLQELLNEWKRRKEIAIPTFLCSSRLHGLYSQTTKYEPNRRISTGDLKKILASLSTKKTIGESLNLSGEKKNHNKRTRSFSLQATILKAKPKIKRSPKLLSTVNSSSNPKIK